MDNNVSLTPNSGHHRFDSLLRRHPKNPILNPANWSYPANSVFNPGAIRLKDSGQILLLARVEDRRGISHLCRAVSPNGIDGWQIDPSPTLLPAPQLRPEEIWGIEDPRISYLEDIDTYAVVYTSFSQGGPGVSLALTNDFQRFEHYGMILPPEDKDAALFPVRFRGQWAMIHRPVPASGSAHIWISFSPDLQHWGEHRILLPARKGSWWDARKIGLATPPILCEEGWLIFYHGVRTTAAGSLYRVGLALLDRENPTQVLYRSSEWIFGPETVYERIGDVSDVVFPTGCVVGEDGDRLLIYYGAADSYIGVAEASIRELISWIKEHSYLGEV